MPICSKPGCSQPAAGVLAYDYASRTALLQDGTEGEVSPHLYALCSRCADSMQPPRGWLLEDRREHPPLFVEPAAPLL